MLTPSENLLQVIKDEITASKGAITFARFMELALYAPGLGYYSAGSLKLGKGGDFVTAPEISPLFARTLARQCQQVLAAGCILELGAGTGRLALDLLRELEHLQSLPQRYFILEISADLRQRQQELLKKSIPHLFDRIEWLDRLPAKPLTGIILANEVMDAMPVHRFQINDQGIQEFYVAEEKNKLIWHLDKPSTPELIAHVENLPITATLYESEINLLLPAWINSLSACLQQGIILLIDYGFPRHEYYHPDRTMGTLMCHYQQRAHMDPLIHVGLQDITAHVDFTLVAESAVAAGLDVAGYATQAAFLLSCGLLDLASATTDNSVRQQLINSQQIQMLTSPQEMGELFKVIMLARNLPAETKFLGFTLQNWRGRL